MRLTITDSIGTFHDYYRKCLDILGQIPYCDSVSFCLNGVTISVKRGDNCSDLFNMYYSRLQNGSNNL